MPEVIMPCFEDFKAEGAIVGRLLSGYGELELELCACIGVATGDLDGAIRRVFSLRGAEKRIEWAENAAKDFYTKAGVGSAFEEVISDMDYCREIRNQYAHCYWFGSPVDGLGFVDLEGVAKLRTSIWPISQHRLFIDLATLEQQEAFFKYVQKCFWYLTYEYKVRVHNSRAFAWQKPENVLRPLRHN
jgi:hypothetical protein